MKRAFFLAKTSEATFANTGLQAVQYITFELEKYDIISRNLVYCKKWPAKLVNVV